MCWIPNKSKVGSIIVTVLRTHFSACIMEKSSVQRGITFRLKITCYTPSQSSCAPTDSQPVFQAGWWLAAVPLAIPCV